MPNSEKMVAQGPWGRWHTSWIAAGYLACTLLFIFVPGCGRRSDEHAGQKPKEGTSPIPPSNTSEVTAADFYYTEKELKEGFGRYRAEYPLESMEKRVPAPKSTARAKELPSATIANLKHLESGAAYSAERSNQLQQVHERHWKEFVGSPKFGAGRNFREPVLQIEQPTPFPESAVAQPGPEFAPLLSTGQLGAAPGENDIADLLGLNGVSYVGFVNPFGFGYVKDRRHVAGFQSHGFREVPKKDGWKVQRVDLVGILLHEEPVVYLTNGLPRMDQAGKAPTRPLNVFEDLGMQSLLNGDDLFVRESPGGLRMLGSLRAVEQCTKCHDCQRGDLLGAFTYCLVKDR